MSEINEETRALLRKMGFTDKMIEEKQKKLAEPSPKKKKFVPTVKKMIKICHCLFCRKTEASYYLMDEISFATWEGHEVSKEQYMETDAIKTKPSVYNLNYCFNCPDYIETLSPERVKEILINVIKPSMGKIPY